MTNCPLQGAEVYTSILWAGGWVHCALPVCSIFTLTVTPTGNEEFRKFRIFFCLNLLLTTFFMVTEEGETAVCFQVDIVSQIRVNSTGSTEMKSHKLHLREAPLRFWLSVFSWYYSECGKRDGKSNQKTSLEFKNLIKLERLEFR